MNRTLSILVAEDDESDVLLLNRAFRDADLGNPVHMVADGQEAIEFLQRAKNSPSDQLPGLVVLDLMMPRRDGIDVLHWMRQQPIICTLPAIIFTSSANRHDVERAYEAGANAYLVKPPSITARTELARFIKDWLRLVQPPLCAVEGFHAAQIEHRGE